MKNILPVVVLISMTFISGATFAYDGHGSGPNNVYDGQRDTSSKMGYGDYSSDSSSDSSSSSGGNCYCKQYSTTYSTTNCTSGSSNWNSCRSSECIQWSKGC